MMLYFERVEKQVRDEWEILTATMQIQVCVFQTILIFFLLPALDLVWTGLDVLAICVSKNGLPNMDFYSYHTAWQEDIITFVSSHCS